MRSSAAAGSRPCSAFTRRPSRSIRVDAVSGRGVIILPPSFNGSVPVAQSSSCCLRPSSSRMAAGLDRRATIDEGGVLAGGGEPIERFRRNGRDAESRTVPPAKEKLHDDVGSEQGGDDDKPKSKLLDTGRDHGHRIAEDVSHPDPRAGPERHACALIDSEPGSSDGEDAGQRRQNSGQPGDELRDQHPAGAVAAEYLFSAWQTNIGLQRQTANNPQDLRATAASEFVPRKIHDQGDDRQRAQHQWNAAALPVRRQGAEPQQGRHRRQRKPELLGDEQSGEDDEGVLIEHLQSFGSHGRSSSGENSLSGQRRQIRGARLALNEQSAERESPESAACSMSDSRRPAWRAAFRGAVRNRSRKDSSVSSLPSVRSTAGWLILALPEVDCANGRPDPPIQRNWAM